MIGEYQLFAVYLNLSNHKLVHVKKISPCLFSYINE